MSYKAVIIAGPTGVGKTNLSLKLAKALNAEIISADSMQVYKGLDIGTAKISEDEMCGIKHHMLDICLPDEEYSVGDYEKNVNDILNNYPKTYILVGGTGLYLSAITEGFSKLPRKDEKLREELENIKLEDLLEELKVIDEVTYNNIDKSNKVRVVRALEICKLSNEKFSTLTEENFKNNNYKFLKIFLNRDRDELYEIIDKRIDIMLEKGLLEEAKNIFLNYPNNKAIGYKELFEYFKGNMSLLDSINLLKQKSRNYAKRQLTWFRKRKYIEYNLSNMSEEDILIDILKKFENEV